MDCIVKLKDYLETRQAWITGYIQYKYWGNIIKYLYGDNTTYNIKKIFTKAVSNDLFYVKKIEHRLYYKYKSINEPVKENYTLYFN
tara:strand:- start:6544 stop:6801 length:258 start_codon:yes stop_codon:yes gene_type:complete